MTWFLSIGIPTQHSYEWESLLNNVLYFLHAKSADTTAVRQVDHLQVVRSCARARSSACDIGGSVSAQIHIDHKHPCNVSVEIWICLGVPMTLAYESHGSRIGFVGHFTSSFQTRSFLLVDLNKVRVPALRK
jgi:hypothetical protein